MPETTRPFIPAAGRDWRLPYYDALTRLFGADAARRPLVDRIALRPGDRVLDLGTGTGGLAIALGRAYPQAEVVGVDPDPKALGLARRKAQRAGLEMRFEQGFADSLPYPDASFDRVVSSFVLHHIPSGERERALREVRRVLRPGGALHLMDFDGATGGRRGLLARLVHSHWHLHGTAEREVLGLLAAAGFPEVSVVGRRASRLGGIRYYEARGCPARSG